MSGQRPGLAAAAALCVLALSGVATRAQLQVPDVKSNRPTPRMANGKPDLSGYWKGTTDTKPVGNIGKDLPGWKLPLTPAGEAALKHNLTATIDPESLCIIGGIPRHNASGLPFEVLQGTNKIAFLYWYSYYRLIPIDANRKHSDDPDPSFFGEELGRWEGDTLVIDSIGFKEEKVWIDENANPHSDALHVVERWTRPDADHIHVETLIEDSKFYTKPFTYSRTWVLGKPDEEIQEYACSENNVDAAHLGLGARFDSPPFCRLDVQVFVTAAMIDHRRLSIPSDGEHLDVLASLRAFRRRLNDDVRDDVLIAAEL
jgi:hypothetical protein